jgi:hypothetical protein
MANATTLPAPRGDGIARSPGGSGDPGQAMGGLSVARDGPRVRVRTAQFSTPWLPDTPSPHHLTVVW